MDFLGHLKMKTKKHGIIIGLMLKKDSILYICLSRFV